MKLFLDTEFNGFGGGLISLALVPEDNSIPEFYCEVLMTEQFDPWVRDNVVPHLVMPRCLYSEFQIRLANYLRYVGGGCTIVADWPDDIKYFCMALITGPGEMINPKGKIIFELDLSISYTSAVPHNALHDARGIKESYMKVKNG